MKQLELKARMEFLCWRQRSIEQSLHWGNTRSIVPNQPTNQPGRRGGIPWDKLYTSDHYITSSQAVPLHWRKTPSRHHASPSYDNGFSKHRPSGPILSISWNVRLCVSFLVSVRLFTFEVPFKRLFAPTSRSQMSKNMYLFIFLYFLNCEEEEILAYQK